MCLDVEEAFKQFDFTNNEDVVKVALTFFIKTVMMILKMFIKDHGKLLSCFMIIVLLNGREWKAGLTKVDNDGVWLQKNRISEHYYLIMLSSSVILKLIYGMKWKVGLTKADNIYI
ncbi:B3 domain-containing transcription factor VRN1-like [Cucumis melo var. makuwa]|uniref:B3 domain-containing transcription factor VRN1-like n=1 Tax=Cucumis melo var. makuwa TaxID=1194695 RepID=A0A5D3C119_CUCMM|nr:B3 domain-containing transcription factor VRN1-like [Cucumis melo var. makuwa]